MTASHVGDSYCLNCLNSYRTEDKLKNHENVCKSNGYYYIEMSKEDNNVLK